MTSAAAPARTLDARTWGTVTGGRAGGWAGPGDWAGDSGMASRAPRTRCAATRGIAPEEVVPGAGGADLDVVAGDLRGSPTEALELGGVPRAPPAWRKPGAEDVGDLHGGLVLADGARDAQGDADVPGRAQELGVRVADLVDGDTAPSHVADERLADEAVLHAGLARCRSTRVARARTKRHEPEAIASTPRHRGRT